MEQLPEIELQQRVNYVSALYEQGSNNNKTFLEVGETPTKEEFENSIIDLKVYTDYDPNESETYLASSSKVAWVYFMLDTFIKNPEFKDKKFDEIFIDVDYSIVHELLGGPDIGKNKDMGRSFERILRVLEGGPRFPDTEGLSKRYIGLKEALIAYFESLNATKIVYLLKHSDLSRSAHWEELLVALKRIPKEDYDKIKFKINLQELSEQTINLSSNATTSIAREYLLDVYDRDEKKVRENLNQLVPSFKNTHSTVNEAHWRQSDANMGKISEFAVFLRRLLVERNEQIKAAEEERIREEKEERVKGVAEILLEDMSKGHLANKGKGWGHDFSTTKTAEEIRKAGGRVYEKTGYYPAVFWVEDLAGKGPHMALSTIIMIELPNGRIITVTAKMNIAVPVSMPNPFLKEEDIKKKGVSYPYYEAEPYSSWIEKIFRDFAGPMFKERVENEVIEQLRLNGFDV